MKVYILKHGISFSMMVLAQQAKNGMDNCRTPGRDSLSQTMNTPNRVSKRDRRLRRWVSFSDAVSGGVSMETEVKKWIINVLGSRAVGLMEEGGEMHGSRGRSGKGLARSLSEGLKDGKVLVRLAHAVGGKRTAGMAKVCISPLILGAITKATCCYCLPPPTDWLSEVEGYNGINS